MTGWARAEAAGGRVDAVTIRLVSRDLARPPGIARLAGDRGGVIVGYGVIIDWRALT